MELSGPAGPKFRWDRRNQAAWSPLTPLFGAAGRGLHGCGLDDLHSLSFRINACVHAEWKNHHGIRVAEVHTGHDRQVTQTFLVAHNLENGLIIVGEPLYRYPSAGTADQLLAERVGWRYVVKAGWAPDPRPGRRPIEDARARTSTRPGAAIFCPEHDHHHAIVRLAGLFTLPAGHRFGATFPQ